MKKPVKIILIVVCFLIIIFIIASAALPAWISSPTGTRTALKWINMHVDGKVSIEKIDLNWFGKQRIQKLKFEDKKGTHLFSFDSFETNTSLFYLAFGGRSFGKTILETPYLFISHKEKEEKEEKETKPAIKIEREKKIPKFKDTLLINNGKVNFGTKKENPLSIYDIFLEKTDAPSRLIVRAKTTQDNNQGSVSINALIDQKVEATILIHDFPLAILDQLVNKDYFSEGLGPKLDADIHMEKNEEKSLSIKGVVKSAHLNANIEGITENKTFIINPQSNLNLAITPSFFKLLIDENKRGDWELAHKTHLEVQFQKGIFPLPLNRKNFQDVILQGTAKISRAELHHRVLGSYSLKQFDCSITALNNLEIAFQGDIQGKEATTLAGHLSVTPEKEMLFDYTCNGFPVTLLGLASTQLESNVRMIFGNRFDVEGRGTYLNKVVDTNLSLSSQDTLLIGHLSGTYPHFNIDASGTHQLHGDKIKIVGPSFDFTLTGTASLENNHFAIPFVKGNIFNPYYELDLRGQLGEEGLPFNYDHLQIIAHGNIKKLPIEEILSESPLQNGTLVIQVDGSKNLITGKAESQAVNAHFEIRQFIKEGEIVIDQADIFFDCTLQDFPLAIASPFIAEDFDLTALLGKTISLTSKGSYTPTQEPRITIDLNAQGAGFSTSLALALDGSLIVRQNRPSYIYWEISPERYNAVMRLFRLNPAYEPTYTLTRSTPIELNITQFTCPTAPSKNLGQFLCQSGFVGDIKVGTTIFRSKKTHESILFQSITGEIKGENFSQALDLRLSGDILAENVPQTEKSAFSFEGQMFNFWTPQGKFNREGLTIKGVLSLDLLPVRQFTGIVPIDDETRTLLQALLGELVNARVYGEISQLSGPVTIDIKSSNFKAKLPLLLKQNTLFLRDYVDAELTFTQEVNEALLKDINPLFITGLYSEHPIKILIDPQGFALPIKPYSLQMVHIGRATIDLGRVHVRNGGQVQALMEFLKAKEISPDGLMEAWFTPIFMSLQNGVATYQRFDALLANTVHIAMWGSINLINSHVQMTLGIAPTTLYQRFKISGLSKTELFQVKMSGTTNHLDLDWSSAQTRITFIIARTAGGHLGLLIGGILEQLVPKLGEEPSPPPTTDPFPWESFYTSDPKRLNSN